MGPAVLIREAATLREAASLMLERSVEDVVVVDADGAVRGIVNERDLTLNQRFLRLSSIKVPGVLRDEVEAACIEATTATVGEVMNSRLTTATVAEPIGTVVDRMLRRAAEYALVVRDGDVVGLLGRRDLLRLIAGNRESQPVAVAKDSTAQPPTAHVPARAGWPALGWLTHAFR